MKNNKLLYALIIAIFITACGGGSSSNGGGQSKDLSFCVSVSVEEDGLMKTYTYSNLCNEVVNLTTVLILVVSTSTETTFVSEPVTRLLQIGSSTLNKFTASPDNNADVLAITRFVACKPPSFGVLTNPESGDLECN